VSRRVFIGAIGHSGTEPACATDNVGARSATDHTIARYRIACSGLRFSNAATDSIRPHTKLGAFDRKPHLGDMNLAFRFAAARGRLP
jgi:hypothetical protein